MNSYRIFSFKTFLIMFIILIISALYGLFNGHFNKQLTSIIEYYLKQKEIKAKLINLNLKNNNLSINSITLKFNDNFIISIDDVDIKFDFNLQNNIFKKLPILIIINNAKATVQIEENKEIVKFNINGQTKLDFIQNKITAKLHCLDKINNKFLLSYNGDIYNNIKKSVHVDATIKDASLKFIATQQKNIINAKLITDNLAISIYKELEMFLPKNEIFNFLDKSTKNGIITGSITTNLDLDTINKTAITTEMLYGDFKVENLQFIYNKDYPIIANIDSDIEIRGGISKFKINKANAGKSKLTQGYAILDYQDMNNINLSLDANITGPISDYLNYIENDISQNLKKNQIDLKKITGNAETKISLTIPLKKEIPNIFNISSSMSNVSIKIFDNKIIVKNGNLKGKLTNDNIIITGNAIINNNNAKINFTHNIKDNSKLDYFNILTLDVNLAIKDEMFNILNLDGLTKILFQYKTLKNGNNIINMAANLYNLEFYIDKISIFKPKNKIATLNVEYILNNNSNNQISINLQGEDNLKIIGNAVINGNKYIMDFNKITSQNTDILAKITLSDDTLIADINGTVLDLSKLNMMELLKKESDSMSTDIKIDIGRIKLKHDISLNNVKFNMFCTKSRCLSSNLNAQIGGKKLEASLISETDLEKWQIYCADVGSLFKSLDLYQNMKSGELNATINTKRYDVKRGEIIPILDGNFLIKRFTAVKTPFLTRLVGFISFPGILNFITNNQDISFSEMEGKFSYIKDVLLISNAEATGIAFDCTMNGNIDTKNRTYDIKGNVIPSVFLISKIVTKIPIIGYILSKVFPYSVSSKY